MALKNFMVAYDGSEAADSALRLGLLMATKYDAHLTAVFAHRVPVAFNEAQRWLTRSLSGEFEEIAARVSSEIRAKVEGRFQAAIAAYPAKERVHWIEVAHADGASLVEAARFFDLVLVGQYAPRPGADRVPVAIQPDLIAEKSGKSVLIVPKAWPARALSETVVLAWDGKRAATRAINDAMQILETKQALTVVTVGDVIADSAFPITALTTHFERHGIRAEHVALPVGRSVAKTILDHCAAVGAELLVMGAYEHSKFGEDFAGGVTNEILASAMIPVLMSH